jgi:hypothetical protein
MTDQAIKNQTDMEDIRKRMLSGVISYDQAKAEAAPIITAINAQSAIIAKKYNKRASKLSFAAIMR